MHGPGPAADRGIALSVHGPAGILDLFVPAGARLADVAQAYAARTDAAAVSFLHSRTGAPLRPDATLAQAGIGPGAVLVVSPTVRRVGAAADDVRPALLVRTQGSPGRLAALWFTVAAALALLAGWALAGSEPSTARTASLALLVVAALVGVVPVGRFAAQRALAAPAFGAAAALGLSGEVHPEQLPVAIGVAALCAAVTAAVARAVERNREEELRVWIAAGLTLFAATALGALLGVPAPVTWAVLLVAAMLAARFVPSFAVDVPDQLLIDLDRLAVTAWSARDRPRRRQRAMVSPDAVAEAARRGARQVTAACAAIAVVAVLSADRLLASVTVDLDRIGARCVVFFAGAALVLAGRSYRHGASRALLRVAGLGCWTMLVVHLVRAVPAGLLLVLAVVAVLVGCVLVVAAVATGRGWRSVWWARRAEVAEGLAGAAALASVLVAGGVFREVWELGSRIST